MYSILSQKIFDKLSTISSINSLAQEEQVNLQSFPGVSILEWDTDAIIEDAYSYMFTTKFTLRVMDHAEDRADTCANMRSLVDEIIAKLLEDPSFGDACIAKLDLNAKWWWADADVPTRVCDISMSFLKNVAI